MEQKKYKLQHNDSFINDIEEITHYISYDLSNPIAANNILDNIDGTTCRTPNAVNLREITVNLATNSQFYSDFDN